MAEPLVAGLESDEGDRVGLGMLVVERFSGVRVTRDLLSGLDQMHVLIPVLEDLRPAVADYHSLRSTDALLVGAIAALPEAELRRIAAWVAGEAVASTSLDEFPAVAETLVAFEGSRPPLASHDLEELVRRLIADGSRTKDHGPWVHSEPGVASYRPVGPETRKAGRRAAAAKTLRAATNPDPLAAALDSVYWARLAFPKDAPNFLDRVRERLA